MRKRLLRAKHIDPELWRRLLCGELYPNEITQYSLIHSSVHLAIHPSKYLLRARHWVGF
jgi:hypothetical protein